MATESNRNPAASKALEGRLGSWKEIASYLNCGVRTVQRWESLEGLPVHRHVHNKMGSVYAYQHELDAWRRARKPSLDDPMPEPALSAEPAEDPVPPVGQGRPLNLAQQNAEPPARLNAEAATEILPEPEAAPGVRSRRMARGAIAVALGAMLFLAIFLASRLVHPQPKAEAGRAMLAVLPFANLSGDPNQDYFSDGLTEEMITELGRVDPVRLGVIARTSAMKYKHTEADVAQIGRELGVSYVLEGSVRRQQQEVRISAQLIRVSDQTHMWAQSYELRARDVLATQQEVARAITSRIQVKLAVTRPASPAAERPVGPEAYEDYLKGRYFLNLRSDQGLSTAVDYFKRSTGKDPSYAPAYAGLADCYALLALYGAVPREVMPQAKAAALKSLALDDSLAEAHTSLAAVESLYDWNWPDAEREFKRALELDPNYSPAHHWYANLYLIPQGRYEEAIAEMKLAKALDPVSLIINTDLGWTYFVARRYDEALEQYNKTLEMSPGFVPVHFRLTQYFEQKHMYDQAAEQAEESERVDGFPEAAAEVKRVYAAGGYRGLLQEQLKQFENDTRQPRYYTAGLAAAYAGLGEREQAFDELQKAFEGRAPDLIYLRADPVFDSLRADPRFLAMEQRLGLVH